MVYNDTVFNRNNVNQSIFSKKYTANFTQVPPNNLHLIFKLKISTLIPKNQDSLPLIWSSAQKKFNILNTVIMKKSTNNLKN